MTRLDVACSGCYQIVGRMTWALIGEYTGRNTVMLECVLPLGLLSCSLCIALIRACPHLRPIDSRIKARQAPEISVLGSAAPAYEMSHRLYV